MLSYKAPFLETRNLTIFTDDVNPDVFYYVCLRPSIALAEDKTPRLEAYSILPESGVGTETESILESNLMMDVSLAATEEDLKLATKEIKQKLGRQARILVPAPIQSGKVYLIIAAAGDEPDPKKWFVTSEVKPSLLGDNLASLVVRAVGQDAKMLIAALDSDVIAATVHYDLEMLGIAPVFNASMKVNWSKVYHNFEKFDKSNFIFYSDEVSSAIDELKETSAIEVHIEELDPEIKAEAMKSMLNELKTEVIKRLFQPASTPLSASEKWEDRVANGVSRVVSSLVPGVHHIRRTIEESQLSETTINLSQKNAKLYPLYPQSLLTSMIKAVGGIKDKIKWIKLDEIPFIDQKVEIRLSADTFKNSNIKSVILDCKVVNTATNEVAIQRSIVFDNDDALQNHFNFTRQKDITYRYDHRATLFMTTESNKLPAKLELDWNSEPDSYIYFNAAEYFEAREVSINLDDTSVFDHTNLIEAVLTVLDKSDKGLILKRTFLFNATDKEQKVLSLITDKSLPLQFNLDLTYFLKESREHNATFEDLDTGFFFIPNPFENKWSVDIVCNADWEKTQKIIFETRIKDAERTDLILNKFDFTKDLAESKLSVSVSLNTPKETFEYRVTRLTSDAAIVQGPWMQHEGPIIVVTDKIQSERIIRATLTKAPDFESLEIENVSVEFIYDDPANNIHIESELLKFDKVGDTVEFKHPMPDFNHKEFSYRKRVRGKSDRYKSDWIKDNREKIDVEIPDGIW